MADSFATMCADKMTPPVRPEIELVTYKDAQLVVAYIPECVPRDKPCYVAERGVYNGSYTRVSDGDRKLSSYEVDRLLENRFQPSFDAEAVEQATMEDLDPNLVQAVLDRQGQLHPRIFSAMSDEEALASLHVIVEDEGGRAIPTLGGLLALGVYPQSFFPRLTVAFAAYDGLQPSTKCLDSQSMAGPLPAVIEDTVAVVKRHLYPGDAADADVEERDGEACAFPLPAVREAVANALMHRDYSPAARGTAVQVSVYSDRIEVSSPGGTYGTVTGTDLGELGYSSTRNQFLSSLLRIGALPGRFWLRAGAWDTISSSKSWRRRGFRNPKCTTASRCSHWSCARSRRRPTCWTAQLATKYSVRWRFDKMHRPPDWQR